MEHRQQIEQLWKCDRCNTLGEVPHLPEEDSKQIMEHAKHDHWLRNFAPGGKLCTDPQIRFMSPVPALLHRRAAAD